MKTKTLAVGTLAWLALRSRRRPIDLDGRVALITGGSRGLGLLMARELARHGCKLVICARDGEELERARGILEGAGAEVLARVCDVTKKQDVDALIDETLSRFGALDVLINNAGVMRVGPIESMTHDDFAQAMDVMFWGPFHTTMAALPHMRARKSGRIVNITSIGGEVSMPHLVAYGAAKFALVGLSEGLRAELLRDGIVVTTVTPGLMRTGSAVNAEFKGDARRELEWFASGAVSPLTAMSARRAARRIVRALRRGEAHVTLSWQAKALKLAHDLFPGVTVEILGAIARMLPTSTESRAVRGRDLIQEERPPVIGSALERAARQNNEMVT